MKLKIHLHLLISSFTWNVVIMFVLIVVPLQTRFTTTALASLKTRLFKDVLFFFTIENGDIIAIAAIHIF